MKVAFKTREIVDGNDKNFAQEIFKRFSRASKRMARKVAISR